MTKYIVAGYAVDSVLPDMTHEDLLKLTHLNVAFGHVKNDEITTEHLKNGEAVGTSNGIIRILRCFCRLAAGAPVGSLKPPQPKAEGSTWPHPPYGCWRNTLLTGSIWTGSILVTVRPA